MDITYASLRNATPAEQLRRTPSAFKADWRDTQRQLRDEAEKIGAVSVRILVDADGFRQDGTPYADGVGSPEVVVIVTTARRGTLTFPAREYADWRSNVRAVALTLEALRSIDRWGVTTDRQQYKGFLALEAAPADPVTRQIPSRGLPRRSSLSTTRSPSRSSPMPRGRYGRPWSAPRCGSPTPTAPTARRRRTTRSRRRSSGSAGNSREHRDLD